MKPLILHGYWRSGTSYRTRIALNLKGVAYRTTPVNLLAGEQHADTFLRLNPQGLVPALEVDGAVLTQSVAILEWIEEVYPDPPLLPLDPVGRAHVRAMAAAVGSDIHPLHNMRVMKAVAALGADAAAVAGWGRRWVEDGFKALEQLIAQHGDGWSYGASPTLADCYLIPAVVSSARYSVDLTPYPAIRAVAARAAEHPAFQAAHPDRQPDAVPQ